MITPIEIISISAVNMMKGIAAVRSRRADRNLKRAAGGAGSFTGVGATREGKNRDFKRNALENGGVSPTIPENFPDRNHVPLKNCELAATPSECLDSLFRASYLSQPLCGLPIPAPDISVRDILSLS